MISADEMIQILDKVDDLPTLPSVYARISELIENPKTSVPDIAKVIEVDQALTGKILRLVNSAFFSFNRQIVSIKQAVVLLGFNTIRNTVLSVSVIDKFTNNTNNGFDMNQFWKHAIACGSIVSFLDKKLRTGFEEETFVAGLLHDMGKVILDRYFQKNFNQALLYSKQNGISFYDSERSVIGFSHTDVGEYLCDRWRLPYSLVEVVALHHQPDNIRSNPKLVALVHLANAFSYELQFGFFSSCKEPEINQFALEELDINQDALPDLIQEVKKDLYERDDLFSLLS